MVWIIREQAGEPLIRLLRRKAGGNIGGPRIRSVRKTLKVHRHVP